MHTMCHECGSGVTNSGSDGHCQICARPFCADCKKKEISSKLDGEDDHLFCCKFCSQNNGKESSTPHALSPYETPLISPVISLSSSGSFVSSCGEFPVDVNFQNREDADEGILSSSQEGKCSVRNQSSSLSFQIPMEEIDKSSSIVAGYLEDNYGDKLNLHVNASNDVEHINTGGALEGIKNAVENTSQSLTSTEEVVERSQPLEIEKDPRIWLPPEPEDEEDDIECSVADNDDDDEFSDGTKWGQPSSLSSTGEEHGRRYRFREERQKALVDVMNGRFKAFLEKLLTEVCVAFSEEACESWLNIVSSLSWEAATLIKPDATEGRAMDPTSYVKVKCIASGSRSQSQVIRGLAFKKNAAHKHMPTKYKNPRLLLLQGVLGQRVGGLSSFGSMEQEKDYLRSTIEMIETCHPNVVLVERTVSRDIQELLLSQGITLVYDMKLPRLERISRCTGSQVVSCANISVHPELKQCDSFHIEKFVEEHSSSGEGGKRPSKTLMYFEGCPKPLGCTILLKGAHNDELKKVKCVVQQAVFLAHHLILETSFLVDHRATFSNTQTLGIVNGFLTGKEFPVFDGPNALTSDVSSPESSDGIFSSHTIDIPISDGFQEMSVEEGRFRFSAINSQENSTGPGITPVANSYETYFNEGVLDDTFNSNRCQQPETSLELPESVFHGQLCPSLCPLERDLGDSISLASSTPYQMISSDFGFKEKELATGRTRILTVSPSLGTLDHKEEGNERNDQEKLQDVICDVEKPESLPACSELHSELCHPGIPQEPQFPVKEDTETESDPLCILVLQSSRCVLGGTTFRKKPHLSRIKYYGDSDMTLGQFLLDNLLNQKNQCSACSEPPDGHVYSYTHKNGKLMILVKRLPPKFLLPGEAEGKLWMWTRCFKCEQEKGLPKTTRRVVMSCAARGLSLGKFFELGFSNRLASSRLSRCGHMLHRDCLHFYGLGSTVAIFRYSSVLIYTACMPPPVLEFNNPNGQEWITSEAKDVLEKGNLLFMEVMNSLQNMVSSFSHSKQTANLMGSTKDLSDVEEMLKQEKSDFEALLQKAINKNGKLGQTVNQILRLNRLNHELLLELYVWDRRLHALGLSARVNRGTCNPINEEQIQLQDEISGGRIDSINALEGCIKVFEESTRVASLKNEPSLSHGDGHKYNTCNLSNIETGLELKLESNSYSNENRISDVRVFQPLVTDADHESRHSGNCISSIDSKDPLMVGDSIGGNVDVSSSNKHTTSATCSGLHESFQERKLSIGPPDISSVHEHLLPDQANQTAEETRHAVSIADINQKTETLNGSALDEIKGSVPSIHLAEHSLPSRLENRQGWVWTPFSETRKAYRKDLQRGFSQKYEFINDYTPAYLSTANQLITQEMSRLHFPVDTDDNVVSVYEDEFSSIIACALALLQDQYGSTDSIIEKDSRKDRGREASTENLPGLVSDYAMAFPPRWFSSSSSDLEGSNSGHNFFSNESSTEGFFGADPLPSSRVLHPEIPLGVGKLPGKSKYSVVCIHGRQFYSLRRQCCPSELDYISSLSRCKKWDPQGGKSGVYFAKTLDDRFIVKQIKKTELDSFLKFAPEYFSHISHSLSSGNQTCLAKILGIYQVIIRQSKSGKEVKIDLIVMENLFFGRNISRMYDLKGVLHRYASDENGTRKVLLDQNFVDDMILSPFYLSGKTKHLLQRAIWNDTAFLTSINVMDYSLLLGVDKQHHEIVFGIIDYLRQYTWDKQLETWVKASLVVPKNEQPTIISPKEYKKRFRNFMSTYFLTVPEHWHSEQCPRRCKSSREGNDESCESNNLELIEKSDELSS